MSWSQVTDFRFRRQSHRHSNSRRYLFSLLFPLLFFCHPNASLARPSSDDEPLMMMMMSRAGEEIPVFVANARVREAETVGSSEEKPFRVMPQVEFKNAVDGYKIKEVIPSLESDHFRLERKSGDADYFIYVVKPLDREELKRQYKDHVKEEYDEEFVEIRIVIEAYNDEKFSGNVILNLAILDSNDEKPTFVSDLNVYLDENEDPDKVNPILTVSAKDEDYDKNGKVTYRREKVTSFDIDGNADVKSDPGNWFSVNAANGQISVEREIDREETERFEIVVVATDGGDVPLSSSATLTVTINDVNDNAPECQETTCEVVENFATNSVVDACKLKCSDADVVSKDNKFSLEPLEGFTCPFKVDDEGVVSTTDDQLDRETEKRHKCQVRVEDPGKPNFNAESLLVVSLKDVDDSAPRPKEKELHINNTVDSTLKIEFIDEDEVQGDIIVKLTRGAEFFELPTNTLRRRRREAAPLEQRLPVDTPFILRQMKKLPDNFQALEFETSDAAGNTGSSGLPITFPGQLRVAEGGAGFPWWIIVVIAIIFLILLLVFVYLFVIRKRRQKPKTGLGVNGNGKVEGKENEEREEEKEPFISGGQKQIHTVELDGKGQTAIYVPVESGSQASIDEHQQKILNPPVAVIEDKIHEPKKIADLAESEENQEPETNDEMLEYQDEGVGSKSASLSSLESFVDEDVDFVNVAKWGLRFGKLSKMLGELEAAEKEEEVAQKREEEIEDNFLPTQEEDSYFLRCFRACDVNNTGHVTTTELLEVMRWMNDNPFGERQKRDVDNLYVEQLRIKYDIDNSFTFDYPEFINLMKGEKIAFAELLFKEADKSGAGKLHKNQVQETLKKAGYSFKGSWAAFLDRFDKDKDNLIDYDEFTSMLRECFAKDLVKRQ